MLISTSDFPASEAVYKSHAIGSIFQNSWTVKIPKIIHRKITVFKACIKKIDNTGVVLVIIIEKTLLLDISFYIQL